MGYYIRVLSPDTKVASLSRISDFFLEQHLDVKMSFRGNEDNWDNLLIAHPNKLEICEVERNPVEDGKLGQEEIREFLDEIQGCRPISAIPWLSDRLIKVKTIYAIQIFSKGSEYDKGWEIIGAIHESILKDVSGITQADNEGFSNEEGNHILWQFSDNVTGSWSMAVLKEDKWVNFEMDLGNQIQREHFFRGEIPPNVVMLD